jgi:hypothetical protein
MKKLTKPEQRAFNRQMDIITICLSDTSKMPCRSFSTVARVHCPGSRFRNKLGKMEVVEACKVCYADSGHYLHASTRAVREFNAVEWKHADFVQAMIKAILSEGNNVFRWFDSGDIFNLEFARKIYMIVLFTPSVKHWIPTRSHKIAKFLPILEALQNLENCVVRYSSDSITGEPLKTEAPQSVIYGTLEEVPEGATICNAYKGTESTPTCEACRECWNPKTKIVAYKGHGKSFAKAHRIALEQKELSQSIQVLEIA